MVKRVYVIMMVFFTALILSSCNQRGDVANYDKVTNLTRSALTGFESALVKDHVILEWDNATAQKSLHANAYSIRVPTSDPTTVLIASVVDGEVVTATLAIRQNHSRTILIDGINDTISISTDEHELSFVDQSEVSQLLSKYPALQKWVQSHIPGRNTNSLILGGSYVDKTILESLAQKILPLSCSACDYSNAPMIREWVDAKNELRSIASERSDAYREMQYLVGEMAAASALCAVGFRAACARASDLAYEIADQSVTIHNLNTKYNAQLRVVQELTNEIADWVEDCLDRNCG